MIRDLQTVPIAFDYTLNVVVDNLKIGEIDLENFQQLGSFYYTLAAVYISSTHLPKLDISNFVYKNSAMQIVWFFEQEIEVSFDGFSMLDIEEDVELFIFNLNHLNLSIENGYFNNVLVINDNLFKGNNTISVSL